MEIGTPGRFVQPSVVASHFHLYKGDRVADFGAGTGYFIKALGEAVGPEGRVYACEVQKDLLDKIHQAARDAHLGNVEPIWADLEEVGGTHLRDNILDAGVLINTLFQLEDKQTGLTEIARVIRSGGKLFVIDWTESFAGMGPQPGDVVDEFTARSLVEAAGFVFDRSFPAGEHHYGLAFRRL